MVSQTPEIRTRLMTHCNEHLASKDVWTEGYREWPTRASTRRCFLCCFCCCCCFWGAAKVKDVMRGVGRWVGSGCMMWNSQRINRKLKQIKKRTTCSEEAPSCLPMDHSLKKKVFPSLDSALLPKTTKSLGSAGAQAQDHPWESVSVPGMWIKRLAGVSR